MDSVHGDKVCRHQVSDELIKTWFLQYFSADVAQGSLILRCHSNQLSVDGVSPSASTTTEKGSHLSGIHGRFRGRLLSSSVGKECKKERVERRKKEGK